MQAQRCARWAITERAREAVEADSKAGQRFLMLAGRLEDITTVTVDQVCHDNDPLARPPMIETTRYLAAGLVGHEKPELSVRGNSVFQMVRAPLRAR